VHTILANETLGLPQYRLSSYDNPQLGQCAPPILMISIGGAANQAHGLFENCAEINGTYNTYHSANLLYNTDNPSLGNCSWVSKMCQGGDDWAFSEKGLIHAYLRGGGSGELNGALYGPSGEDGIYLHVDILAGDLHTGMAAFGCYFHHPTYIARYTTKVGEITASGSNIKCKDWSGLSVNQRYPYYSWDNVYTFPPSGFTGDTTHIYSWLCNTNNLNISVTSVNGPSWFDYEGLVFTTLSGSPMGGDRGVYVDSVFFQGVSTRPDSYTGGTFRERIEAVGKQLTIGGAANGTCNDCTRLNGTHYFLSEAKQMYADFDSAPPVEYGDFISLCCSGVPCTGVEGRCLNGFNVSLTAGGHANSGIAEVEFTNDDLSTAAFYRSAPFNKNVMGNAWSISNFTYQSGAHTTSYENGTCDLSNLTLSLTPTLRSSYNRACYLPPERCGLCGPRWAPAEFDVTIPNNWSLVSGCSANTQPPHPPFGSFTLVPGSFHANSGDIILAPLPLFTCPLYVYQEITPIPSSVAVYFKRVSLRFFGVTKTGINSDGCPAPSGYALITLSHGTMHPSVPVDGQSHEFRTPLGPGSGVVYTSGIISSDNKIIDCTFSNNSSAYYTASSDFGSADCPCWLWGNGTTAGDPSLCPPPPVTNNLPITIAGIY
jgi:hypothetical protein